MTPKATNARWVLFGFGAVVLQGLGIAIFVMVSRSDWGRIGRPAVLAGTLAADVALLVWILAKSANVQSIFVAATCLAAAYVAAFHLVGLLVFGGLLRDVGAGSADYLTSVLRVFAAALLLFTICSSVVFGALKLAGPRPRKQIE